MKIRFSTEFITAYKRLKKKYRSLQCDFEGLLLSLQTYPDQGVALFEDIRKIRLSITSKQKGKSGGARVIVRVRVIEDELQFLYIYDKNELSNVSDKYLKDILTRMLQ